MKAALSALFASQLCFAPLRAQHSDLQAVNFDKADSVAALYPHHSLGNLKDLAVKLTAPLKTDVEKFRAIYMWVCDNIENDYDFYVENKRNRERLIDKPDALNRWSTEFSIRVFKKLLAEQKTVCTGYAYLVKELATQAGLSCVIIDGYGRTAQANIGGTGIPNHSWNAIQLDNKWYLCDATWSSGAMDPGVQAFVKKYNNSYFLADPVFFVRNHYPLDTAWILLHSKPTPNEFLNRPLVYNSIYRNKIIPISPNEFEVRAKKGGSVTFRFKKTGDSINKVELEINGDRRLKRFIRDLNGIYSVDHVFNSRGRYLVHVLVDEDFAFSYNVTVK